MHESTKRLSYPYIVWISIIIIIPMLLIFLYSVIDPSDGNPMAFRFTINNYTKFFSPIYISTLVRSLWIALWSTLACLLFGYPLAWVIAQCHPKRQSSLLLLFIMPMWINFVLRTAAMKELLYLCFYTANFE